MAIDVGKNVFMLCGGIAYYYVECPHCGKYRHIYSRKANKVHSCYYCAKPFIEPSDKPVEVK